MAVSDLGDDSAGNQRLFNNLRPLIGNPPPSAYRAGDHLEAAYLALRLKAMAKPRYKAILQISIFRVGAQHARAIGTAITKQLPVITSVPAAKSFRDGL